MSSPIGPDFHYHTRTAREPSISPDGASVLYTVGRFERDQPLELKDVYLQRLDPSADREPRLLLENAEHAVWSPDGKRIAFLRPDEHDIDQLWACAADGSDHGVASRLALTQAETHTLIKSLYADMHIDDGPRIDQRVVATLVYLRETVRLRG
ncbi:MAG: hypothetical protein O3B04_05625 [Chloroflexi bacterium]|nr:hypothetical protein [Chloroflexota bacterium]MDA1297466.1 hypothetical protein [Chloroflexota bacterium]